MLDEIEKYLLEIFGDKTNALKLNKDFMKSLKKSDQLEGGGGRKDIFSNKNVFKKDV